MLSEKPNTSVVNVGKLSEIQDTRPVRVKVTEHDLMPKLWRKFSCTAPSSDAILRGLKLDVTLIELEGNHIELQVMTYMKTFTPTHFFFL